MTDKPTPSELHEVYCNATGIHMTLTMSRIFAWDKWISHGWTKADLLLVIGLLKQKIKERKKWDTCTNFFHVVQDTENFDELLGEARARARVPKVDKGKQSVLEATGRTTPQKHKVKSAQQILAESEALKELLKLRDNL